jgi:hypothetical protein
VDPGGTTGLAVWESNEAEHFEAWSVPAPLEAIDAVELELRHGLDQLVIERFTITGATTKKTRGGPNTAIEIIGAVRWLAHDRGSVPVTEQAPSDAMGFATNDRLKLLRWYTTNDHARDATRHLVLYLVNNRLIDPHRVIPSQGGG